MSDDVLFEVADGVATVTLNRPKAINSLTLAMCESMLHQFSAWAEDQEITTVEFHGAGERGFCAGADIRLARENFINAPELARRFFAVEYRLNALLADYPKPIISHMRGITMGGGMGLTTHSRGRRVADQTSKIAMPETTIGLWPDVGVCYELSRAPGQTGVYLAMTGTILDGASALYAGLVDEAPGDAATSTLAQDRAWIDECFAGNDACQIVERLLAHGDERARAAADTIRTKSPWSVWVSLEAVRRAENMHSVAEVLDQDLVLSRSFVADSDFVEGVRAQIVDKDRNPKWRYPTLADVPPGVVSAMFEG
ncbi:MAG: enoyl-CoA hydratase/isomerase family protein [Propionibacteriaceae bacterium]|nr:enoyl-CoA hydratase/isomerase family protein [Propionibacteriaceae bacterium]